MSKIIYSMLSAEKQFDSTASPYCVYGIRASRSGKTVYQIEDFSLRKDYTETVIALLSQEEPEDVHIAEIIEDFIY